MGVVHRSSRRRVVSPRAAAGVHAAGAAGSTGLWMRSEVWTCQYRGCGSSADQIAILREGTPTGFPHDEEPSLKVCTVCRRLPLRGQQEEEEAPLDNAFLAGIKEELSTIEESDNNVQALSQVFRYYAKHAKQLSQVLFDFVTKQCFPWEIIHALHLVDDILLMDNTGRYKAELQDRVQAISVCAFKKVQKEQEKREVAKMLHTWQELKIFDYVVIEAVRAAIRSGGGPSAGRLLDEAAKEAAEEVELEPASSPEPEAPASGAPVAKKPKVASANGASKPVEARKLAPAVELHRMVKAILDRIISVPLERPFELLGITAEIPTGMDIRQAYRRIALQIHPDKNPGHEVRCQEALIRLQQGREQAETELQKKSAGVSDNVIRGGIETRSAATAAAANAAVDASFKCKYHGCDLPPCKQCANGCCQRNITHCHLAARQGGMQCFFHPPPRAWARNA